MYLVQEMHSVFLHPNSCWYWPKSLRWPQVGQAVWFGGTESLQHLCSASEGVGSYGLRGSWLCESATGGTLPYIRPPLLLPLFPTPCTSSSVLNLTLYPPRLVVNRTLFYLAGPPIVHYTALHRRSSQPDPSTVNQWGGWFESTVCLCNHCKSCHTVFIDRGHGGLYLAPALSKSKSGVNDSSCCYTHAPPGSSVREASLFTIALSIYYVSVSPLDFSSLTADPGGALNIYI